LLFAASFHGSLPGHAAGGSIEAAYSPYLAKASPLLLLLLSVPLLLRVPLLLAALQVIPVEGW
jgi:hypothetical protein